MSEKEPNFNINTELRKISSELENMEIDPSVDICCGENHIHYHFQIGNNTIDINYIPNIRPERQQDAKIEIVSCIPFFSQVLKYDECKGGLKKLIDIFKISYNGIQEQKKGY
jgi:hypothetical protein